MIEFGDQRIPQRIWRKITVMPTGCWQWRGALFTGGYGAVRLARRTQQVHRVIYLGLVGPIPDGQECDHICRCRSCCNPKHIEPVTRRENVVRGDNPAGKNAGKTTCVRGHPFDVVQMRRDGRLRRQCSRCRKRR